MSIEYSPSHRRLGVLVSDFADGTITIPPHQRDYVWTLRQQKKLIDAVFEGLPMPNITLRIKRLGQTTVTSLEDGQQRLKTLHRYMTNAFRDNQERTFSQLSDVERSRFESYVINILTYTHASDSQAIVIFNNLQNGSSCSVGERIFSLARISPIVQFAIDMLLTPGMGFYDRTVPFWGERSVKGQRGAHMTTALALCAGLAYGSRYISKKWSDIEDYIALPFDARQVTSDLETIVSLYEDIHRQRPILTKHAKKTYWDLGTVTGYMVHALKLTTETEPVHVIPSRTDTVNRFRALLLDPPSIDAVLQYDVPIIGRAWVLRRWHLGWRRLFAANSFVGEDVSRFTSEDEDDTGSET